MKPEVREALKTWGNIKHETCRCASDGHYMKIETGKDKAGRTIRKIVPRPDGEVCARERAWRHYVKVRGEISFVASNPKDKISRFSPSDIKYLKSIKAKKFIEERVW